MFETQLTTMTNYINKFSAKKYHKNLPHLYQSEKLRSKVNIQIKRWLEVQRHYLKKHSRNKNNHKGINPVRLINQLKLNKRMKTSSKMQKIVMWFESLKALRLNQRKMNIYKKINILLLKVCIYRRNSKKLVKTLKHTLKTGTVQNKDK